MSGMEDLSWLTAPRDTYDRQFHPSASPSLPLDAYENFIKAKISESTGSIIPLVTDDTLPYIPDGHLVCVHGMIQDMFDSELYISSYRPSTEANSVKSTRYRDVEYLQVGILGLTCFVYGQFTRTFGSYRKATLVDLQ
ncbi:unnamed protein product [Dibothriocephalus latus]|uniref:Mini-chromosome maintenance complex-binding protein n=1 Tax=Dibothriocephalus latus TaxID=60516 RepID=A0A3P7LXS3_DIBLA|nr:unnamed protein product [Dibothriocephalus latus]